MYNENDLKTFWYAYKGGMKKYQVAQLMGVTEEETNNMLDAAQKLFGGMRKQKDEPPKERRAYFHKPENIEQPLVRPLAKYDNKSPEERIEEYLNMDV